MMMMMLMMMMLLSDDDDDRTSKQKHRETAHSAQSAQRCKFEQGRAL